jgi:hypothetical protein
MNSRNFMIDKLISKEIENASNDDSDSMPILEREEPQWNGLDPLTLELLQDEQGFSKFFHYYYYDFLRKITKRVIWNRCQFLRKRSHNGMVLIQ